MTNAKYPIAKMPNFSAEQLAWLRGHFYRELDDPTKDVQLMASIIGANQLIVKLENAMANRVCKDEYFRPKH